MCIDDNAASAFSKSFSDNFRPPDGVAVPLIAEANESDRFLGFMTCLLALSPSDKGGHTSGKG
jgi:hypothetical protein